MDAQTFVLGAFVVGAASVTHDVEALIPRLLSTSWNSLLSYPIGGTTEARAPVDKIKHREL